jgi:cytochrome c-type biogenesis protein CcmE
MSSKYKSRLLSILVIVAVIALAIIVSRDIGR